MNTSHTNRNDISPRAPRTFNQRGFARLFLVCAILISCGFLMGIYQYFIGKTEQFAIIPIGILFILLSWFIALIFYFDQYILNEEEILHKSLFNNVKIRFNDLDKITTGPTYYQLWNGNNKVTLETDKHNYSLAYIRILEELAKRKISITNTSTHGTAGKQTEDENLEEYALGDATEETTASNLEKHNTRQNNFEDIRKRALQRDLLNLLYKLNRSYYEQHPAEWEYLMIFCENYTDIENNVGI